jgi:hypothetical protein
MGSGEIGSNGSVHQFVRYDDGGGGPAQHSVDPIQYNRIGLGTGGPGKNHQGAFAVRMRFKTKGEAEAALEAAKTTITGLPGAGGVYATCMVPVVNPKRQNEDDDPFLEVRVDW